MLTVSQLYYHPVKSLGAIESEHLDVGPCGPLLDRRIMLVDADGKFVTQRQAPIMALISVEDRGNSLRLSYQADSVDLPWPDFSEKTINVGVVVWGESINAQLMSADVSQWLSDILNKEVRLVYMDDSEHRQVDLDFADQGVQTSFSDGFPFLLISKATIDFLSEKVGYELSPERFRPNIIINGCKPFEEDTWREIKIGNMTFDVAKPCSRCVIPTINLTTADKEKAVMMTMQAHCKKGKNVYVGQNLVHQSLGDLQVGNVLTVLK